MRLAIRPAEARNPLVDTHLAGAIRDESSNERSAPHRRDRHRNGDGPWPRPRIDLARADREKKSGGAHHEVRPVTVPVKFACEAIDFDPTVALDKKTIRRTDRYAQIAVAAARAAVDDAQLEIGSDVPSDRIGTSLASGMGGLETLRSALEVLRAQGAQSTRSFSDLDSRLMRPTSPQSIRRARIRHERSSSH